MEEGEGRRRRPPRAGLGLGGVRALLFCYLHGLVWVCSRVLFSLYPLLTSPHPSWASQR